MPLEIKWMENLPASHRALEQSDFPNFKRKLYHEEKIVIKYFSFAITIRMIWTFYIYKKPTIDI